MLAVYSERGYLRNLLISAFKQVKNSISRRYRGERRSGEEVSDEDAAIIVKGALDKPPPRALAWKPFQGGEVLNAESKINEALKGLDFIDHEQSAAVFSSGSRQTKALIPVKGVKLMPSVDLDRFSPIEIIEGGNEVRAVIGSEKYNLLINVAMEYVSKNANDAGVRLEAGKYLRLNRQLNRSGYGLAPGLSLGSYEIEPLGGRLSGGSGVARVVTLGHNGPFYMDENWQTPFTDYPPAVRQAILENFSDRQMSQMSQVIASRVLSELDRFAGWKVGVPYVAFTKEWELVPDELQQATLKHLTARQRDVWLRLVKSNQ